MEHIHPRIPTTSGQYAFFIQRPSAPDDKFRMRVVDVYEMRAGGCRCCGPSVIIRMSEHEHEEREIRGNGDEEVIEGEMGMWKCGKGV